MDFHLYYGIFIERKKLQVERKEEFTDPLTNDDENYKKIENFQERCELLRTIFGSRQKIVENVSQDFEFLSKWSEFLAKIDFHKVEVT